MFKKLFLRIDFRKVISISACGTDMEMFLRKIALPGFTITWIVLIIGNISHSIDIAKITQ
jgi:hypothetical protein